jgi:polysaccharide biosynthesis protein PslH
MPRVWNSCPEAQLFVVGKDPPPDVKKLENRPQVTVTGTVDDIRPYLWRATVSIVPLLYGAGIQNKILEAMATGTPVATTSRTLSALQAQPGKDLLVADKADEFAQNILQLINDTNLARAIGDSGLAYVRSKHDWISIASQLTSIYKYSLDKRDVRA